MWSGKFRHSPSYHNPPLPAECVCLIEEEEHARITGPASGYADPVWIPCQGDYGTWKWWGLTYMRVCGIIYYFIDGWSLRNGEVESPVAGWSNAGPLIYCISLPVPLLVQVSHTKFNCCNSPATLLVDRLLKFSAREKLTDFWVIDPCPQIQSNISGYEWLIWY